MNQAVDILIVGGGPAGAFLAYKLAKLGMKTVVLEKSPQIKRKVCGEYLCPLGVELLEQEGIALQTINDFLPLKGMLIVTPSGTEVRTEFPYPQQFHGVSVNRELFDNNLLQIAMQAGADIKLEREVKKIQRRGEHWVIDTNKEQFVSRILIGADGRRSIVSKLLENDAPNSKKRVALHAFTNTAKENIRQGEMHIFKNGAYVGLNPTGTNEVNFSLVLDSHELQNFGGPLQALNHYILESANLKSRFQLFTKEMHISATYPIQHSTKSITPQNGVALVGDAAGFVDPLTGEGMYNALLSAKLLAEEISIDRTLSLFVTKKAFSRYRTKYAKVLKNKTHLNKAFQRLIRHPLLVELIAKFLLTRQARANAFIGIIGNIYTPLQGIIKIIFTRGSLT
jgi:geranylgeranyl reductase family protein